MVCLRTSNCSQHLMIAYMVGSAVYSKPRKLNGLATYSRHVGQLKEGGAIGVSLFYLIQSYKCQSGGLNKVVRNQCTALMVFVPHQGRR